MNEEKQLLNETVDAFAAELKRKLSAAEDKHKWNGLWRDRRSIPTMQTQLQIHIQKGDPRDVAAYAMFLWYHGASTNGDV